MVTPFYSAPVSPPTPLYRLLVRDPSLTITAEIDQYIGCTIQPRFNGLGAWVLEIPADVQAADEFVEGAGLVVVRNGQVLLSGPMTRREDHGDEQGDRVILSGYDDMIHLIDRDAFPCAPPFTTQADDVRVGPAESVMYGYVGDNAVAGGAWVTGPRVPVTGLSLAPDLGRGLSVTGRARFVNLMDLLTDLALSGGDLGFRVVQTLSTPPTLQFQVYVPVDRSASAVFSREMGNLRGYEYVTEAPTGNAIYVAGQGEGNARVIRLREDTASVALYNRRIEVFVDRRDATTTAELDQTGDEDLVRRADRGQLNLQPIDTEGLSFLAADLTRGYQLGDKVTVIVHGVPVQELVREVRITLSPEKGEELEPVVGTPGAVLTHTDTYVLRNIHRRLSLQERR